MKRFFERTFKPFFIIAGLATAVASLFAFCPAWALAQVVKLEFVPEYTIIVQHWGMMVGLMGGFMVIGALQPALRNVMLIYSGVEKAFMVFLFFAHRSDPFGPGFLFLAITDGTISLYTIAYFAVCGFKIPCSDRAQP
jgi:uncharacterized membrane protein YozB (DUF420 family)